jgi:hypothetical protein
MLQCHPPCILHLSSPTSPSAPDLLWPAPTDLPNLQQLASRDLTRSEVESISTAVRRSAITVSPSWCFWL